MKSIIRLSLLAVVASVVAAGSASADDQRLQDRQNARQAADSQPHTTTVAAYGNHRGVGHHTAQAPVEQQSDTRFELRSTAHGTVYGVYTGGR